jgi:hypothetical protein
VASIFVVRGHDGCDRVSRNITILGTVPVAAFRRMQAFSSGFISGTAHSSAAQDRLTDRRGDVAGEEYWARAEWRVSVGPQYWSGKAPSGIRGRGGLGPADQGVEAHHAVDWVGEGLFDAARFPRRAIGHHDVHCDAPRFRRRVVEP